MNEDDNQTQKPAQISRKPVSSSGRVFDVVRPGQTPASATSRPVIVGHKPQVHDTLIGGNVEPVDGSRRPLMSSHEKISLEPQRQPDGSVFVDLHALEEAEENRQQALDSNADTSVPTMSDDAAAMPEDPNASGDMPMDSTPSTSPSTNVPDTPALPEEQPISSESEQVPLPPEEVLSVGAVATESVSAVDTSAIASHPTKRRMPWWEVTLVVVAILIFAAFGVFVALNVFGVIE